MSAKLLMQNKTVIRVCNEFEIIVLLVYIYKFR
jgi:hypothetical protein